MWSNLGDYPEHSFREKRKIQKKKCLIYDCRYDQEDDEWVVVLQGEAQLQFEGEASPRHLNAGDYVLIPAHTRHRVASTSATRGTDGSFTPTVWLAVHHGPEEAVQEGQQ